MPVQVVDIPTSFRSTQPWFVPPTSGAGVELYYQANPTTYTLMAPGYVPSGTAASSNINPGVRFTVDVPCTLSAIRIYHVAADTSTFHWVYLWRSDDQSGQPWVSNLETQNEVTGWNPVYTWVSGPGASPFVPVELEPGITYTVTYWAQSGTTYASHTNALASAGSGILHANGGVSAASGGQYPSTSLGQTGVGIDLTVTLDSPAGVLQAIDRATNIRQPLVLAGNPTYVRGSMQVDQHLNVGQPAPTSSTPGLTITQPDPGNGYVGRVQFRLSADQWSQTQLIIENPMAGTYTPMQVLILPSDSNASWISTWYSHDTSNSYFGVLFEGGIGVGSTGSRQQPDLRFNIGQTWPADGGYPAWQITNYSSVSPPAGSLVPGYDGAQNFLFVDIGENVTPLRPRDLWLSRDANVGRHVSAPAGRLGLGFPVSASGYATIGASSAVLTGTSQYGMSLSLVVSSAATTAATGQTINMSAVAGSYTINTWTGLLITSPVLGANVSVFNLLYGIHIAAQDTANLSGYGILIDAHNNQFSEGIHNNAPTRLMGAVNIAGAGSISLDLGVQLAGTWGLPMQISAHSNNSSYSGILEVRGYFDSQWNGGTGAEVYARVYTQAATYTIATARCFQAAAPWMSAGAAITELDGLYVANLGLAGVTNVYGVYIAAQSGASSTNIGLYNGGSTQMQGPLSFGSAPSNPGNYAINLGVLYSAFTGTSQTGILVNPVFTSAATSTMTGISVTIYNTNTSYTTSTAYGIYIGNPSFQATPAVTTSYGLFVNNQGMSKITNAYGVYILAPTGAATTNLGLYNGGTSWLYGHVGIGNLSPGPISNYVVYIFESSSSANTIIQASAALTPTTGVNSAISTSLGISAGSVAIGGAYGIYMGSLGIGGGNTCAFAAAVMLSGNTQSAQGTITALHGLRIENYGAANVTNVYGIYVVAQTGATSNNIGIYNAGSMQTASISRIGDAWVTPTLLNAWSHYGAPWGPVQYRKMPDGRVIIRGIAQGGAVNTAIFTLPVGFRPASNYSQMFACGGGSGVMRIDVAGADGTVLCTAEVKGGTFSSSWQGLNEISFLAES